MAKTVSADRLLKRLQKIESAQGRLGEITTRIRAQADTLAELLKVAQGFVDQRPVARARSAVPAPTAAVKRTVAKRSTPQRSATTAQVAASAAKKPATPRAPSAKASTTARRRGPRKTASD